MKWVSRTVSRGFGNLHHPRVEGEVFLCRCVEDADGLQGQVWGLQEATAGVGGSSRLPKRFGFHR